MKGQLFVHMQEIAPEKINLRTGFVKQQLGADHFLLEFTGAAYRFSNVFSASQLARFAFFNTEAERQQFLTELQAQSKTPDPGVTVDPPAAAPPADGSAPSPEAPGL